MRADIVPGAHFPDYELTGHTRTRRQLSEIQGIDLMIVILSRGHYCPEDCTLVNKGAQVIAMRCRISSGVASRPRLRSAAVRGVVVTVTPKTSSPLRFSWNVALPYFPRMTFRKFKKSRTRFR